MFIDLPFPSEDTNGVYILYMFWINKKCKVYVKQENVVIFIILVRNIIVYKYFISLKQEI